MPAGSADAFLRMQQAECKAQQRACRCYRCDGKGGFVHCSEKKHRCTDCERLRSFQFDDLHPASFEGLLEWIDRERQGLDWDNELADPAEVGMEVDFLGEDAAKGFMEIILEELRKRSPKYGSIFMELLNGNLRPLNIAKALGLPKSQVYTDVKRVQKLAAEIYFRLLDG